MKCKVTLGCVLTKGHEGECQFTATRWPNGHLRANGQVTGTAKQLRNLGFRDTQFGWTDSPMSGT